MEFVYATAVSEKIYQNDGPLGDQISQEPPSFDGHENMLDYLREKGIEPSYIKNFQQEETFFVYHF